MANRMVLEQLGKVKTEKLRATVGEIVQDVLGLSEITIVNAAMICLGRGMSQSEASEHLHPLLEDDTGEVVARLYKCYFQMRGEMMSSKNAQLGGTKKKRGIEDVFGDDVDDEEEEMDRSKASKLTLPYEDEDGRPREIKTDLTPSQQREFEEKAMREINRLRAKVQKEEDKRRSKDSIGKEGATAYLSEAMASRTKKVELQETINQRMAKLLPGISKAPVLDKEGRTLDASGRTINVMKHEPTLKVNIRESKRKIFKLERPEKPDDPNSSQQTNPYFDPRMTSKVHNRSVRPMKFNDPGKYVVMAQKMRAQTKLHDLQKKIADTAKRTGISTVARRIMLTDESLAKEDPVPEVEWWDKFILVGEEYTEDPLTDQEMQGGSENPKYREITHLIEHPVSKPPPGDDKTPVPLAVVLTKKERKKLRTQRRLEKQREEQEKIRLGLIPPPPPKVRIANLMRVLCSEAVQDPTKVEANVRAQAAERQKKHLKTNAERQLTKEQRSEKKVAKLTEDTSDGVHVTVFKIDNLSSPQHKYKVETNAQQFMLTGIMLLHKDHNLVIVEGGPKALRKFKRLMLVRIKWNEDVRNRKNQDEGRKTVNHCKLIWEGTRKTRYFSKWTSKLIVGETSAAKDYLTKYNCQNLWDLAMCENIATEEP